jgi:hypothetical protein
MELSGAGAAFNGIIVVFTTGRIVVLWNALALLLFLALSADLKMPAALLCGAFMLAHISLNKKQ